MGASLKMPTGKEGRIVMLHAVSKKMEFLNGNKLVFVYCSPLSSSELNASVFKE